MAATEGESVSRIGESRTAIRREECELHGLAKENVMKREGFKASNICTSSAIGSILFFLATVSVRDDAMSTPAPAYGGAAAEITQGRAVLTKLLYYLFLLLKF